MVSVHGPLYFALEMLKNLIADVIFQIEFFNLIMTESFFGLYKNLLTKFLKFSTFTILCLNVSSSLHFN
jgi:hypothetical protein